MSLPRLSWHHVPRPVRDAVEGVLGARVARAQRAAGGFAPSAVFALRLVDGRRVVFKGADLATYPVLRELFAQEERFYRTCAGYVADFVPTWLGAVRVGDWSALLLESVGAATLDARDRPSVVLAARGLARMHEVTAGVRLPTWLPRGAHLRTMLYWRGLREERCVAGVARLTGEHRRRAGTWLGRHVGAIQATAEQLLVLRPRRSLLHGDARADNICLQGDRLKIFDWSVPRVGPAEFDIAYFAQSVATAANEDPEAIISAYRQQRRLRDDVLDSAVASLAGAFAYMAWRPAVPYTPGLRPFQRRQLRTTLRWTCRRLGLPPPPWLDSIA